MTPTDLDALNRRIFTKLGWWKPGQMCSPTVPNLNCPDWGWRHKAHEIPPPNIMDWDTFGRVLVETKPSISYQQRVHSWLVSVIVGRCVKADSPQLALALAVDDAMEQK